MADTLARIPAETLQPLRDEREIIVPEEISSRESFYATGLSRTDDPVDTYQQTKAELETTGGSSVVKSVRERLAKELNVVEDQAMFEILYASDMSPEEKASTIQEHFNARSMPHTVDMQGEFMIESGSNQEPSNPNAKQTHANILDGVDEVFAARNDIKGQMDMLGAKLSGSTGKAVLDFLSTAVPFNISNTYREILQDVLPKQAGMEDWVLPGEALVSLKDHLNGLPPEEQKAFARDILKSIDENSGLLESNDFIKYVVLHEVFSEIVEPENQFEFDVDRFLENTAGILDVIMLGQTLRGAAGIVKVLSKTSPAYSLKQVNPNSASTLLAEAMVNPDVAKALGVTPEQLITDVVLPKPLDFGDLSKAPANVADELKAIQQKALEVKRHTEFSSINLKAGEKAEAVDSWKKVLTEQEGAVVYNNMMEVGIDGEQLIAKGVYGMDAEYGWPTGKMAFDKAQELFGDASFTVMKRKGDVFVKAKTLSGKGEFFIQFESRRLFDSADALIFDKDVFIGGAKAQYVADPSARFSKEISDAGLRAHDLGKAVSHEIQMLLRPFQGLKETSQLKIVDVVQEGSKTEKTFNVWELYAKGLNDSEVKGYYAWRSANDSLYMLNNSRYHARLASKDIQHIVNKDGWEGLGIPIKQDLNLKHAFDPKTNSVKALSPEEIEALYKSGGSIVELRTAEIVEGSGSKYAIVRQVDGSRVQALPENVLKYNPGYVTRYYKDMYFLDELVETTIDGVKQTRTRTVASAGSKQDALRLQGDFNTQAIGDGTGVTYQARRGIEFTAEERTDRLFQIEQARGKVFFSKRGEQLKGIEGLAEISDPVDSLLRAIEVTSRAISHEPFVQTMKKRWTNTYQDLLQDPRGGWPSSFTLKTGAKLGDEARIAEARSLYDYIQLMEGVPDSVAKAWKSVTLRVGEAIENAGLPRIGKYVREGGTKDPTRVAKGWTFRMFLAANPLRQIILQSQQFSFVAPLAPKYMLTSFLPDKLSLDMAMAIGRFDGEFAGLTKTGAKLANMSIDDYKTFVQQFRDSGLPFSIDANVFVRDSLVHISQDIAKTSTGRAMNKVLNTPKGALQLLQKVGFDFGEYNNLASTWLIARKRYLDKTGKVGAKLNKTDLDLIAADSRQLALSMTEAGSLGYQRGWLSLTTQFISVQHKALLAAMPKKFGGSQAFTTEEKGRILLGQMLFYGANGWGLASAYEHVRDKLGTKTTPETDAIIKGGLADYLIYKALPESSISVSKDLAPMSGIKETTEQLLFSVVNSDESVWATAFGPSWDAGSRVFRSASLMRHVMLTPNLENAEKLKQIVSAAGSTLSGYNNYIKAKVAMTMGYHVNNSGDPIVEATFAEAIAQLGGFSPESVQDYYKLTGETYRTGKAGVDESLKGAAKEYYRRMTAIVTKFASETPEGLNDLYYKRLEAAIETEAMVLSVLDDQEKNVFLKHFREFVNRGVSDKSDFLISKIAKLAINGEFGTDAEYILNKLRNSRLITTPEQEAEVQELYDYMTKE